MMRMIVPIDTAFPFKWFRVANGFALNATASKFARNSENIGVRGKFQRKIFPRRGTKLASGR
jgi:hypothetical protein